MEEEVDCSQQRPWGRDTRGELGCLCRKKCVGRGEAIMGYGRSRSEQEHLKV